MDPRIESEIIEMYSKGISIPAIASETGRSAQTIRNLIKTNPKAQAAKPIAVKSVDEVKVAEAYTSGERIPVILEKFGIQRPRLYYILSKYSVPTRQVDRENARSRAMEEAISLYKQGVVIRQITQDTGIHQPTLHAELAKRGIELRRPRAHG